MLDPRVETFLTVCRYMNFTHAAEALHITQPAVSQHIHYLESEYHTKFFHYSGKALSLTPAGELFLRTATTMRHDEQHLKLRLNGLSVKWQKIIFGATLTVGEYIMPSPLAGLMKKFPEAEIRMVTENTSELLAKLDNGMIDFAIIEGFFEKKEYDSLPFLTEDYVAVCAPGYSFSKPVHSLEDLLSERLLTREPGSGTRELLERHLKERNLTIHDFSSVTEIGNLNVIKSLISRGLGIAFLYEPTVRKELSEGTLCQIPLSDFHVTHDFTFLWRKNSVFAEDYRGLYELLKQFIFLACSK